jgi:hypothetical protein
VRASQYRVLCRRCGRALLEPLTEGIHIGRGEPVPSYRAAVYIAEDAAGTVLYVGSVHRASHRALVSRIREHMKSRQKRSTWEMLYVLPLDPEIGEAGVRAIESLVGDLLSPTRSVRLPLPL